MLISVIIPARNEERTLPALLDSLANQTLRDFETIVADDCSTDGTAAQAERAGARLLRLERPSGPAAARNAGAAAARGELLLFMDADTLAPPDLVERFARAFAAPAPPVALVGRYDPHPLNAGWFPRYKARLVEHWFAAATVCDSFETNLGAIPAKTFRELGGFDERYRGADVEDYEFGDRVWRRGPILMDPGLTVRHHFPGFWRNARNFFTRSRMWAALRASRGRGFDRSAATRSAALSSLLSLLLLAWPPALLALPLPAWLIAGAALLALDALANRRLLMHLARNESPAFALVGLPVTVFQQAAAAAGALIGAAQGLLRAPTGGST